MLGLFIIFFMSCMGYRKQQTKTDFQVLELGDDDEAQDGSANG